MFSVLSLKTARNGFKDSTESTTFLWKHLGMFSKKSRSRAFCTRTFCKRTFFRNLFHPGRQISVVLMLNHSFINLKSWCSFPQSFSIIYDPSPRNELPHGWCPWSVGRSGCLSLSFVYTSHPLASSALLSAPFPSKQQAASKSSLCEILSLLPPPPGRGRAVIKIDFGRWREPWLFRSITTSIIRLLFLSLFHQHS